jgi:hypothetical protein
MRLEADLSRIEAFFHALSRAATKPADVFLTGGATAVLFGWRGTTLDVDLKLIPDSDELLRAIPKIKEKLQLNIELAAPDQFIPELPGWRDRSIFIRQVGKLAFWHYDAYSQALSKIERGHAKDHGDVEAMAATGLIEKPDLLRLFAEIEDRLYRYPAIDPREFRSAVEAFCRS